MYDHGHGHGPFAGGHEAMNHVAQPGGTKPAAASIRLDSLSPFMRQRDHGSQCTGRTGLKQKSTAGGDDVIPPELRNPGVAAESSLGHLSTERRRRG